jgi:hypothetical protein
MGIGYRILFLWWKVVEALDHAAGVVHVLYKKFHSTMYRLIFGMPSV